MAKKKSERYRDKIYGPTLQVRDNGRILGKLEVAQMAQRIKNSNGRPVLFVNNSPSIPLAMSGSHRKFLSGIEKQKRERRPRTIKQDGPHIKFPDFSIRAEKLLPIVQQALNGGMREIEYTSLRRLLGM